MTGHRFAWLLGALLLLGACTSHIYVDGHPVPSDDVEKPQFAAWLVGSIGYSTADEYEPPPTSSSIRFRRKGSAESGAISVSSAFGGEADYADAGRRGKLFAIPLKPGDYEIVNAAFWYGSPIYSKSFWGREDFSVPFAIEAGKAYYIGEFLAFGRYDDTATGFVTPAGAYFVHRDSFERDRALISKKYGVLKKRPIVNLELEVNAPPLIVPLPD